MINISVLVSGGGSNLQALIDGIKDGRVTGAKIALVLSSKDGAYALERARNAGIDTIVVSKSSYPDEAEKAAVILKALTDAQTDLVVAAGYMSVIDKSVCKAYAGRLINIHPSLLPKHSGIGYYGLRVHKAVLESGDAETGATVHFVDDEGIDTGDIIMQKSTPVFMEDTPESLQKRVLEEIEHPLIVEATNLIVEKLRGDSIDNRVGS